MINYLLVFGQLSILRVSQDCTQFMFGLFPVLLHTFSFCDAYYFYEAANLWVGNVCPAEKDPNLFLKHTLLYNKSMHNTQNQHSQSAM